MSAVLFTLSAPARHEVYVRKSLFLVHAFAAASVAEAMELIKAAGNPDATHNCWAYKIGPQYRSDDDNEPSGTAGRPILQAIESQSMDQVAVVVTRWFGGIKLGAGGLVRAYGGAAAQCLRAAERTPIIPRQQIVFECAFSDHALIRARLDSWHALIEQEDFGPQGVTIRAAVPLSELEEVKARLIDITRGQTTIKPG